MCNPTELVTKAINDLCKNDFVFSYTYYIGGYSRDFNDHISSGQWEEVVFLMRNYFTILRRISGWSEEEILHLVRVCGCKPILMREESGLFYWFITIPTKYPIFNHAFNYVYEFDQCLQEIRKLNYRHALDELLPSELIEHIISFT